MNIDFSFEKKKKLADRIQKLNSKHELQQIKSIITDNNPDLEFMKNSNGYFMQFQNLSLNTYIAISKFLDKMDRKTIKNIESEVFENSEILSEGITHLTDEIQEKNISKKLRLTNTESHILNRVKYEKELEKNEMESTEQIEYYNYEKPSFNHSSNDNNSKSENVTKQDDIFVHKDPKKSKKSKK